MAKIALSFLGFMKRYQFSSQFEIVLEIGAKIVLLSSYSLELCVQNATQ